MMEGEEQYAMEVRKQMGGRSDGIASAGYNGAWEVEEGDFDGIGRCSDIVHGHELHNHDAWNSDHLCVA